MSKRARQWVLHRGTPRCLETGTVLNGVMCGDVVLPAQKSDGLLGRRAVVKVPVAEVYSTRDKARDAYREMQEDSGFQEIAGALGIDMAPRETFASRACLEIKRLWDQLSTERESVRGFTQREDGYAHELVAKDREIERLDLIVVHSVSASELEKAEVQLADAKRNLQAATIRIEELGCFRMMLLAQRADLRKRLAAAYKSP